MLKQLIIALVFALLPISAFAWDQVPPRPMNQCQAQLPFGIPQATDQNVIIMCKSAYVVGYSTTAKIPAWVSYTLTPQHAEGCEIRSNAFIADKNLPTNARSIPDDYANSGFDKGHIANDADMSWDQTVQNESFLMSNMSPQYPATNRGTWKVLETTVRSWVIDNNISYTIYAGNIWLPDDPTIGKDKVKVPGYLYKIIINDVNGQVQAYAIPNKKTNQGTDLKPFLTSVAVIEQNTGIMFPVPGGIDKNAVAQEPWPVDINNANKARKAACQN